MKPHFAPAWLLPGIALVLLPFTFLLKTSAHDRLRNGKKSAMTISSVFTVTNNMDDGPGSLRDAITLANSNPGPDTIDFGPGVTSIPVGLMTMQPLPDITEAVTIDGGVSRVELTGNVTLPAAANGLTISASGVTVKSLVINSFPGNGIEKQGSSCTIQNSFIGVNGDCTPFQNLRGILVTWSNNLIE